MRNNYSNFNQLSVFGKVTGKPEFFDGLMSFPVFQEGTNLFMNVLCEENRAIKLGHTLDLRGKLMFDAEDEELILHATDVFVVSTGLKVKDVISESLSEQKGYAQKMESTVRKEVNLPTNTDIPTHSEPQPVPTYPTNTSEPQFETPNEVVHVPNSQPADTGFKLFKVSQPQTNAPQEPVQQYSQPQSNTIVQNEQPVQNVVPVEQFIAPQPSVEETPVAQSVTPQQPVENVPDDVISVAPRVSPEPVQQVSEEPVAQENTGYDVSDFDC